MKAHLPNIKLSQQDLEEMVRNRAGETIQLIFKLPSDISADNEKLTDRLAAEVSAFANTIGGTIIFGIAKKRRKADAFSFIDGNAVSPSWLLGALQSKIYRNIEGLLVYGVPFDNDPAKTVLVISIPESKDAPHIAPDKRFYKRYNFRNTAMEEYEVRMAYNKLSRTNLEYVGVLNTNGIPTLTNGKFNSVMFLPKFLIRNAGPVIEKDYKFEISIPTALCDENYYALNKFFTRHDGVNSVYSIPNNTPLFQDELTSIAEAKIVVNRVNHIFYKEGKIIINLFFTDGIKSSEYNISDTFRYNNKVLCLDDFV
ncbi:MAG: ATP-binding protein [Bacteroidia bacterium]|nr:ATP-binding protein [Bacteroidia bacterium]